MSPKGNIKYKQYGIVRQSPKTGPNSKPSDVLTAKLLAIARENGIFIIKQNILR